MIKLVLFTLVFSINLLADPINVKLQQCKTLNAQKKCRECSDILNTINTTDVLNNSEYFLTKSENFSCLGNHDSARFYFYDLPVLNSDWIFNSMALFPFARNFRLGSNFEKNMYLAIKVLTNSAGTPELGQEGRENYFGKSGSDKIGFKLLELLVSRNSKLYRFYANAHPVDAVKGMGPDINTCILDYRDEVAEDFVTRGVTYRCEGKNQGHFNLDIYDGIPKNKVFTRTCEMIVNLNNIKDLVQTLKLTNNDRYRELRLLPTKFLKFENEILLKRPELVELFKVKNMKRCIAIANNNFKYIQRYFAFLIEPNFE